MNTSLTKKGKNYLVVFLLFGTAFFPLFITGSTAGSQSSIAQNNLVRPSMEDGTEYWALVVGIGVYADNPEEDRPDMLLEVEDFRDMLLQSDWWSDDHIKMIKGEDATVTNIIAGLRWLDKMEDSDDISVVYLSTHGFPLGLDIPPKDEADETDEALVSYWGFAYTKLFIWDDQLNILLNRLESQGVCLIVDSCYAGGFNDPPNWNITGITTPSTSQHAAEWVEGFGEDVRGQNRVVIMASREDEVSYSGGFGPYIIDGFRGYGDTNGDDIISAEEAFYYAKPRSFMQHPTIYDGYDGELPIMNIASTMPSTDTKHSAQQNVIQNKKLLQQTPKADETSLLLGFISETNTTIPIENAVVSVRGRINDYEYYENQTTTNATGFYQMNTPAIRLRVTASADGYCERTIGPYQMYDNTTRWVNLSLYERPVETALVCGYITDQDTAQPLDLANISLFWQASQQQYYQNETTTDLTGFYHMSVAAGTLSLEVEKNGYFSDYVEELTITDEETLWVNISLSPRPVENAVICGYLIDNETGEPLSGTRIDFEWVNIDIGASYGKETQTNATGFYTITIAPGELYMDIWEQGYEYYDPYRHDALENATTWLNCSLTRSTIEVEIAKPLKALYKNNERIMPYPKARIIGSIDVTAYIPGGWDEPGDAEKVEFYIDNVLQATLTEQPYNWTWSQKTFGKHTIKVVAYDFNGDVASAELEVYKFL